MSFDPTPGFNLGIKDLVNRAKTAASSFTGSSGTKANFSNPTGEPAPKKSQPKPAPKPTENQPGAGETRYSGVQGAATTAGARDTDPATAAYYGDMASRLKSYLDNIPETVRQGETKINSEFNVGSSRLNEGLSRTLRDLGIKREEAQTDKQRSLEGISANVGNTVDSYKRLLGLGHAGVSAFGREFVPRAVARVGSQQRGEVFDTAGRNFRSLDISEGDARQQHTAGLEDLKRQRDEAQYNFKTGVEEQRQSLIDRLSEALFNQQLALGGGASQVKAAIAPYSQATNDIIARLTGLYNEYQQPQLNVTPVEVDIPELEQYTRDPLVARLSAENSTVPQQYLPYLPSILKRRAEDLVA